MPYSSWRGALKSAIVIAAITVALELTAFSNGETWARFSVGMTGLYFWYFNPCLEKEYRVAHVILIVSLLVVTWTTGVAMYQWTANTGAVRHFCNREETSCRDVLTYAGERYRIRVEAGEVNVERLDNSIITAVKWYFLKDRPITREEWACGKDLKCIGT